MGRPSHLLLRKELGVRHSPRLAFQSQFEDSGRTTAMTLLQYVSARAMATSSLTGASLFRETDAHHWTVLWDEADNAFHKNANPELFGVFNAGHSRKFAIVHRQVPSADGGYETQTFDTFTAIALTAIHEFPSRAMQSRCIVLVMKRATKGDASRLEEFDEGHEAALTVMWPQACALGGRPRRAAPGRQEGLRPDQPHLVELATAASNSQARGRNVARSCTRRGQGRHGPGDRREGQQRGIRPA